MSRPSPLTYLPLWQRVLECEIGIRFRVAGIERTSFRNTLYEARRAAQDPSLSDLIMFLPAPPHDDEIWICKKTVELDP
jgi:hypothetical protein